jgi:hypothetical protein
MLLIIFCKPNKPAIVDKLNKRDRNIVLFGGNEKTKEKEKEKVGKMRGGVADTFIWISKKKKPSREDSWRVPLSMLYAAASKN